MADVTRETWIASGLTAAIVLVVLSSGEEDDGSVGVGQPIQMTKGTLYQGRMELPTSAEAYANPNPENPPLERATDTSSAAQIAAELVRLGFGPDVVVYRDAVSARPAIDPRLLSVPSRGTRWFSGVWTGPTGPTVVSPSGRIPMLRRIG